MSTVSIEEANFVDRMINGKYRVKMPAFLAAHDSFDNWERERFESMEKNLKQGDVLFDVGAETGHISAIYARFVGPENMVLFESNPDNWQNIKATWEAEGLADPMAGICALVGAKSEIPMHPNYDITYMGAWPIPALTGRVWTPRSYRYIHEHAHNTMQFALDDVADVIGGNFEHGDRMKWPAAITIDVEGAELEVLVGAKNLLKTVRPLVWVSVHPDLMLAHYRRSVKELLSWMAMMEYREEWLATDHEIHYLFRPGR